MYTDSAKSFALHPIKLYMCVLDYFLKYLYKKLLKKFIKIFKEFKKYLTSNLVLANGKLTEQPLYQSVNILLKQKYWEFLSKNKWKSKLSHQRTKDICILSCTFQQLRLSLKRLAMSQLDRFVCSSKFTQFLAVANQHDLKKRSKSDIVWNCWNRYCEFETIRLWIDGWDFLLQQTAWICYTSISRSSAILWQN